MRTHYRTCLLCDSKEGTSYHLFPKNPEVRLRWMEICNLNSKIDTNLDTVALCSRHFSSQDFSNSRKNSGIRLRLRRRAVPTLNLAPSGILPVYIAEEARSSNGGPRKDEIPMPIEPLVEADSSIPTPALINERSIISSTHYIQKDEVERFEKCWACMEPLPNELYRAPVTMLCYDDKTVKDGLQCLLVPQLAQQQDDTVTIKDEDFICDSCFIVLRNSLKFLKKCLHAREHMKDLLDREAEDFEIQIDVDKNAINVNHCSFVPLRYAKVPDHNEVISIQDVVPRCLLSLQNNGVTLLQNCKTYDNFYENKRVLLVGNRAYVNCPLCDEQFVSEDEMLSHFMEGHNLSKAYILEQVLQGYEQDDSNECQGCGKTFSNSRFKNVHLERCQMFLCSYCDNVFNWSTLAAHTEREHGDPYPFKCFKCKLEQSDYNSLKTHICNGRKCDDCGKTFFHESKFVEHKKKSCLLKNCRQCKEKISVTLYDKHKESHNTPCPKCGKVFRSRYSLRKHVNRHNTRLCPICGKVYKVLSEHMKIHAENRIKNISCSQCPKLFHRQIELRMHVKQAHEPKMVMCEVCGEQFRDNHIQKHIMLKHATSDLQCELCGKRFVRVRDLKRHVSKHNGTLELGNEKPSKTKKYDVRKNNPVVCKHCLKSFKNSVYLRIHMKTHTKNCRVRCRYCSNTYANIQCRWQHEVRHHRTPDGRKQEAFPSLQATSESIICTVCGELFENDELMNCHLEEEHNVTSEAGPVVTELAKEVLMGFQALDYDESLFFVDDPSASNYVEIVQMDGDSDS